MENIESVREFLYTYLSNILEEVRSDYCRPDIVMLPAKPYLALLRKERAEFLFLLNGRAGG